MATAAKQQVSLKIADLFSIFTRERQTLRNVSPKTLIWYRASYRAFASHLEPLTLDDDIRSAVKAGIMGLANRISPVSINGHLRCLNCFFNWLHVEGYLKDRLKFGKLKEPESLPKVLPDHDIDILLSYKPTPAQERAAHVIALAILDIGARIDELRNLKKDQIDFDTCVLLIDKGKGRKQRQLPFSPILRSHLMKYIRHHTLTQPNYGASEYVFVTKSGRIYSYRNLMRALHTLGTKAGIPVLRFHQLRHSMATQYLRGGGNVVLLRRILGHSSVTTTMRYEHLCTQDLAAAHKDHSLLVLRAKR